MKILSVQGSSWSRSWDAGADQNLWPFPGPLPPESHAHAPLPAHRPPPTLRRPERRHDLPVTQLRWRRVLVHRHLQPAQRGDRAHDYRARRDAFQPASRAREGSQSRGRPPGSSSCARQFRSAASVCDHRGRLRMGVQGVGSGNSRRRCGGAPTPNRTDAGSADRAAQGSTGSAARPRLPMTRSRGDPRTESLSSDNHCSAGHHQIPVEPRHLPTMPISYKLLAELAYEKPDASVKHARHGSNHGLASQHTQRR